MITETNEVYHANAAISHSKLETFRRRPVLYWKKFIAKTLPTSEPSSAFRIGSAAHCAILEPSTFDARYVEQPKFDRRTKDGKEQFALFSSANADKTLIDGDELQQVRSMAEAVRLNPLASELLSDGTPELSWRTNGKLALQCRTDWFNATGCDLSGGKAYVADVKTVESLDSDSFRNFERAVFSYGYHRQAGFYLPLLTEIIGWPVFNFFFIAVEKVEPFGVQVYRLSDDVIACGQDETISDLTKLKRCIDNNDWPNIPHDMVQLGLPRWYSKESTQ